AVHRVEAIELALDVLTRPAFAEQAATLARELGTPTWRRALEQMRGHLVRAAPAPLLHGNDEGELGWRIRLGRHDLEVAPVFVRPKKTGGGLVVRKLAVATLTREPRRWRHPADEHVLAELTAGDHGAPYRAIQHLAEHPRVLLDPNTDAPVHVRRTTLVQAVREDGDGARLGLELDGELLPLDTARDLVRRAQAGVAVDADPERRIVRVIAVPPEAGGLLETWATLGDHLPAEALPELVGYLTEASAHVPVHVPEALTGDEVESVSSPILQLEAPADGAVTARLVVRPLPERASENPGMGPEKLLARRGDDVIHCVRDFAAELSAAGAMAATLGLPVHEEGLRHQWGFDDVDAVLDVVSNARRAHLPVEWGGVERYRVGRAVRGSDLVVRAEGGSGRDWFSLEGEAVGEDGAKVPLREILRALRERRRYVRLDDGSFAALDAKLRGRLEALAATTTRDRMTALAAPLLAGLEEAGVDVGGSAAWIERMARLRESAELEVALPGTLRGELRDYQREGFRWLARLAHWSTGACLADDMGLGKTIQALALMLHRGALGPQLVIAPTSLGFNWEREAERFAPSLKVSLFRGAQHVGLFEQELGAGDVVVTSYDLAARYITDLKARRWATVILDEAQAIKNPETQRSRAVFALDAEFVLALTGTPVENRTGEIWSLFRAIAPGLLGGKKAFRESFAVPIERLGRNTAREALAMTVRPFVLRRLKREVAKELPPRTDVRLDVDLSAAERALYEELRTSAAESLAGLALGRETGEAAQPQQQRFMVLQALTRLRQLACHPRLVDARSEVRSSKLAVLLELVEELRDEGHRALVFSQFTTLLALVRSALDEAGIRWRYLDGQTSAAQRRVEVDAFQAGDGDVFLLSLKAGGTGLNLTAADYVVHLDPWWNPAVEDQATDRAHRIGQDKPVTVYRLVARGTVEEGIMALHDDKRELAEALLAGTDAARALTVEELAALVRGSAETRGGADSDEA
ncbi:MAG: DEAD/DEAH box helicase, partial [Deltaproteobacteria bacterium]